MSAQLGLKPLMSGEYIYNVYKQLMGFYIAKLFRYYNDALCKSCTARLYRANVSIYVTPSFKSQEIHSRQSRMTEMIYREIILAMSLIWTMMPPEQ